MSNGTSDNKYSLQVKWSDRDPIDEEYSINNKVRKIRDDAGAAFGIPKADLEKYQVLWDKGDNVHIPLPIDSKLEDIEGLGDGACLLLQAPDTPLG